MTTVGGFERLQSRAGGVNSNVGGRDRIGRALLAVVCTVLAVRAFTSGNRAVALAATVGALGFGFNAVACFCGLNAALGIDTTDS